MYTYDPIRALKRLETGAKLANIIERLFYINSHYRPGDLLNLLDAIDRLINEAEKLFQQERAGIQKAQNLDNGGSYH